MGAVLCGWPCAHHGHPDSRHGRLTWKVKGFMSTRKRPSSWSPVFTLMFRQVSPYCLLQGCHSASFGSTRNTVAPLNDWSLKQTRSATGVKCVPTHQRQTNDSRYCQRHQAWCGDPFLVSGWHAVLWWYLWQRHCHQMLYGLEKVQETIACTHLQAPSPKVHGKVYTAFELLAILNDRKTWGLNSLDLK